MPVPHPAADATVEQAHKTPDAGATSMDLLLRFFESDFFDEWIAVT